MADQLHIVGDQQAEIILSEITRRTAGALTRFEERCADLYHQKIALAVAVPLVEELEIIDIDTDQAPLNVIVLDALLHLFDEGALFQQSCHFIAVVVSVYRGVGQTQLTDLAALAVKNIHTDDIGLQPEILSRDQHQLYPVPVSDDQPKAVFFAMQPGDLGVGQTVDDRFRIHQLNKSVAFTGMDQLLGHADEYFLVGAL